ncbi:MAG TPA: head decoration protein, partial [Acetobacteraceae bacterium]
TWSGGFLVSEARNTRSRDQVLLKQQSPAGTITLGGTVLGKYGPTTGAPVYAATGGNTGNFTCGAVVESAGATVGAYKIEFIAATVFNVTDPNGVFVGEGKTGVAFLGEGIGFTLTAGGTAAVAGDSATVTVAASADAGKYGPLNLAGTDGTQIAAAILFNTLDASAGDTKVCVISREAEVNTSELQWPTGISAAQITAALAQLAVGTIQIVPR